MPEPTDSPVSPASQGPNAPTSQRRRRQTRASVHLVDVARAANVSTASASRALTRPELVSEALRDRVAHAASQLGYVANAAARSLSTQRSGLVGAVLADPADPLVLQMLESAERTLSAQGLGLVVRVACTASPVEVCARILAEQGVEGLLFVGSGATPGPDNWKPGGALPFAGCGQTPMSDVARSSATVEERGLALARAYLEQLGHTGIGILGRRRDEGARHPSSREEVSARAERGERLDDVDAARDAARRLIEDEVTAIVALSDVAAAAAVRECRALGIAVPGQISVIGWGDTALARCVDPALTSVRVPATASGRAAAGWLIAALAGRTFAWPDLLPKLVIRESTGPAPL